jgi:hypothetical protein
MQRFPAGGSRREPAPRFAFHIKSDKFHGVEVHSEMLEKRARPGGNSSMKAIGSGFMGASGLPATGAATAAVTQLLVSNDKNGLLPVTILASEGPVLAGSSY